MTPGDGRILNSNIDHAEVRDLKTAQEMSRSSMTESSPPRNNHHLSLLTYFIYSEYCTKYHSVLPRHTATCIKVFTKHLSGLYGQFSGSVATWLEASVKMKLSSSRSLEQQYRQRSPHPPWSNVYNFLPAFYFLLSESYARHSRAEQAKVRSTTCMGARLIGPLNISHFAASIPNTSSAQVEVHNRMSAFIIDALTTTVFRLLHRIKN